MFVTKVNVSSLFDRINLALYDNTVLLSGQITYSFQHPRHLFWV